MLRRLTLCAMAAACLVPAAAHAQASSSSSNCPSFQVLNDDRIGSLSLPAGAYAITINTPSTLSCAAASDLFRQFLEDFDGRLAGGWSTNAATATFSRPNPGAQSFSVKRSGSAPPSGGASVRPTTGGTCPATFQVLHDDHIGSLVVPAGKYRINLVAAGRMTCDEAASSLAQFLQDYNGRLARPWTIDDETGTFLKGSVNVGFELEPLVGTPPASYPTLKLPGDGQPCNGTFQVLHDDTMSGLKVPRGRYLFVPLAKSSLSCAQTVTLIREFLTAPHNRLPSPWKVRRSTGTFRKGSHSSVGFRLKPASAT